MSRPFAPALLLAIITAPLRLQAEDLAPPQPANRANVTINFAGANPVGSLCHELCPSWPRRAEAPDSEGCPEPIDVAAFADFVEDIAISAAVEKGARRSVSGQVFVECAIMGRFAPMVNEVAKDFRLGVPCPPHVSCGHTPLALSFWQTIVRNFAQCRLPEPFKSGELAQYFGPLVMPPVEWQRPYQPLHYETTRLAPSVLDEHVVRWLPDAMDWIDTNKPNAKYTSSDLRAIAKSIAIRDMDGMEGENRVHLHRLYRILRGGK